MMKCFVSYSKSDSNVVDDLVKRLAALEEIEVWRSAPCEEADEENQNRIRAADIIVFCVSESLLSSNYVRDFEIRVALNRHNSRDAIVIPVVVQDCLWKEVTRLHIFPSLPASSKDIISHRDIDEALSEVTDGILNATQGRQAREPSNSTMSIDAASIEHINPEHSNLFTFHKLVQSDSLLGYPYVAIDSGRRYFIEKSHDHIVLEELDEEKLDFMADYEEDHSAEPLYIDADVVYESALREYRASSVSITVFVDDTVMVVATNGDSYGEWEYSFVNGAILRTRRRLSYKEGGPIVELDDGEVQLLDSTSEYKCVSRIGGLLGVVGVAE